MGRLKSTIMLACAAVVLIAAGLAAQGTPADRATYVTVSGPVSLPGVTLPAGTYLFRLADTQGSRNVVQIYDRDRTKIFATLIAVPAQRNEASDEAVVTFKETPSDRPPALRYWFYAGEKSGQEFAYPRALAQLIANASGESVLSYDLSASETAAMNAALSRVEPANATPAAESTAPKPSTEVQPETPAPAQPAPAPAAQPAPTTAAPERTEPARAPAASSAERTSRPMASSETQPAGTSGRTAPSRELPRTASELPLVALLGFVALGAAVAAHRLRRSIV